MPVDDVKRPLPKRFLFEIDGVEYFQSPGLGLLRVGKNREGYWTSDHTLIQVEDLLDVLAVYLPFSHAEIENDRAAVKAARLARTHTHHRAAPAADVAEIETVA